MLRIAYCYDAVGRQLKKSDTLTESNDPMSADRPVSSISNASPKWHSATRKSKIDNKHVVAAWIESNEELSLRAGQTYRMVFGVECQKQETIAYIASRSPLGIEETTIDLRLDNEKPFTVVLELSPDYKSA